MLWLMVSKAAERSRRQRHDTFRDPIALGNITMDGIVAKWIRLKTRDQVVACSTLCLTILDMMFEPLFPCHQAASVHCDPKCAHYSHDCSFYRC